MHRRCQVALSLVAIMGASAVGLPSIGVTRARADITSVALDQRNTGWDGGETQLAPAQVGTISTTPLVSAALDGAIYAQPLVRGTEIIVATEHDRVYGLNATSGAQQWMTTVGTYEPDSHSCNQVTPHLGVTSTPVLDPSTNTVYVMARDYPGMPSSTTWKLHALDATTGHESTANGFPVTIAGTATNDPTGPAFDPYNLQQRPGLLLVNGEVLAGFGSFCDQPNYRGWISTVSTTTGALHLWTTEPGGGSNPEGALWMSGGGLTTDGSGRIFAAVANGVVPAVGGSASGPLGNALVRLQLGANGVLTAVDFFAGWDAQSQSNADLDLGSSAPMLLPDSMGTAAHPHLLVVGNKYGTLYLLDRDHLGGRSPDQATENAAVPGVLNNVAPLYSHCSAWPAGAEILCTGSNGPLAAYAVDATRPMGQQLVPLGDSRTNTGYASSSPLVTTNGATPGTAVAWIANRSNNQLEAYNPLPDQSGRLARLWSGPLLNVEKFSEVVATGGVVYDGTADGNLIGFGPGGTPPFTVAETLDVHGGIHPVGASPSLAGGPSWPGASLARGLVLRAGGQSGYVLDAWGGIHPVGGAPAVAQSAYWYGWDIARGIVLRADGVSGYVLDGWGGIHPFGGAPAVGQSAYWYGWDIARGIVLRSDGVSGYVLDGWGALHPFGGAVGGIAQSASWAGWDIARALVLQPGGAGGYVLDGWGGIHPFGTAAGTGGGAYWSGWDIARSIALLPGSSTAGYTLDGWGGVHPFGGAPAVSFGGYTAGSDIARALAVQ